MHELCFTGRGEAAAINLRQDGELSGAHSIVQHLVGRTRLPAVAFVCRAGQNESPPGQHRLPDPAAAGFIRLIRGRSTHAAAAGCPATLPPLFVSLATLDKLLDPAGMDNMDCRVVDHEGRRPGPPVIEVADVKEK